MFLIKTWKTEPLHVARCSDDLSKAVKSESNLNVAGFRRNIFKYSVGRIF